MAPNAAQQASEYEKFVIDQKLCYYKPTKSKIKQSFADEISDSLSQKSKFISPKFFYDKKGSKIFEQICTLPEYYLTRTEIEILESLKTKLPQFLKSDFRLVELGSGSAIKTRLLLDILSGLQTKVEYFPIDISEVLKESSEDLQKNYDNLSIVGIIDAYEEGLEFVKEYDNKQNLIVFLGSSFGNFSPGDGMLFLHKVYSTMKKNDLFLIGLDLVKEKNILEDAYNDSQGVTSDFNLNVLSRINSELGADFDLSKFAHRAIYNEEKQRVEMYLKSLEKQTVKIPKASVSVEFEKDELIHTEHSHKYSISQIEDMMQKAGFNLLKIWTDSKKYYSLVLASKN